MVSGKYAVSRLMFHTRLNCHGRSISVLTSRPHNVYTWYEGNATKKISIFEVFTVVNIQVEVFLVVTPCNVAASVFTLQMETAKGPTAKQHGIPGPPRLVRPTRINSLTLSLGLVFPDAIVTTA